MGNKRNQKMRNTAPQLERPRMEPGMRALSPDITDMCRAPIIVPIRQEKPPPGPELTPKEKEIESQVSQVKVNEKEKEPQIKTKEKEPQAKAKEKEKEPQVKAKDKEKDVQSTPPGENEDNDSSKIRRSTRIKKLETSRGGARRREVVFSQSDRESISSRSFDQDEDSNSNSNSNSNSGSGNVTPSSVPNLANLSITSPFGETPTTGITSSSSSTFTSMFPSSTMKLKSRWRYSLDAESFKSSSSVGTANSNNTSFSTNLNVDNVSLSSNFSSSGATGNFPVVSPDSNFSSMPKSNLISKPGYILADSTDTELMEKLKKFEGIEENIFLTERHVSKEGRGMVCDCFLTREEVIRGDIGCNEDCLNRLLMVECSNRCPTGDRCTNKSFQRKQYCGLEVFQTEKKGHGLRTNQLLPEGGFVIEYVGEVLDPREFKQRTREYAKGNQEHFYFMALKSDAIIDATLKGNCSRFINHSCEPNCETQKWTVNGELRIGFFAIKDLEVGEEITFDYQFQRYGKKAQQCFCLTPSCRGWIGGDEETSVKEPGKIARAKVERKKKRDTQWEDKAFEEEITKLETTGLRNKMQTLNLCRIMVRAEDWDARERILNIIIGGELPCRRLFLDYHGLRLLWAWMLNLPLPSPDAETQLIRNDRYHLLFLKALASLPIPNKTILQDTKILSVIEKWSTAPSTSTMILKKVKPEISEATSSDSVLESAQPREPETPADGEIRALELQFNNVEIQPVSTTSDNVERIPGLDTPDQTQNDVDKMELDTTTGAEDVAMKEIDEPIVQELKWEFVENSKELLNSWAELKEVFRIPKKERVEQMKQHERAADISGGLPPLTQKPIAAPTYSSRGPPGKQRFDRRVPGVDSSRDRDPNRYHGRPFPLLPQSNLSKEERRHLFAERVARQEEEERNKQMQDHMVGLHQERCAQLGLDVAIVPIVDPTCTYYLEPKTVTWKEINLDDPLLPREIALIVQASQLPPPQETPEMFAPEPQYEFPPWPEGLPPPPPLPPSVLPKGWRMAVDDEGRCYYYDIRSRQTQWHPPDHDAPSYNSSSSEYESTDSDEKDDKLALSEDAVVPDAEVPRFRLKVSDRSERRKKSGLVVERLISPRDEDEKPIITQKSIRSRKLQLMEQKIKQEALEAKSLGKNTDEIKDKDSPSFSPAEGIEAKQEETLSEVDETKTLEAAEASVESEGTKVAETPEQESTKDVPETEIKLDNQSSVEANEKETSPLLPGFSPVDSQDTGIENTRTDSPGSSRSITPPPYSPTETTTEDGTLALVRDPSSVHLTPTISKLSEKKKVEAAHRKSKSLEKDKQKPAPGSSLDKKHKAASIEVFRSQIANVIVQHLNPYRKPKCKTGRITTTEDFKHLARKMTHAIALKELKHCRDGKTLVVSESVKHKTKEYVKKYMAKYQGREYIRSPDDSQL